jgi:hypothetical protein
MIFESFPVGLLACNCTILGDEESREAIVIDPGDEVSRIAQRLNAQGLWESPDHRFKNKPTVAPGVKLGPCDGQAEFEGHVKSRRAGRGAIQLDPREIVNGITAALYQRQNSIKPAFAAGDSEGGAGLEAKVGEANDVRKVEAAKPLVVRNVYENCVWLNERRHACSSYLALKCS